MGRSPVRVGQLNHYIGRILKTDPILSDVSVIGEISNLKFHSSGHIYFSLKDDTGRVGCFLSSSNARYIDSPLEDGMEIVASGYISVYERGGSYSLNVMDIETGGLGQLAERFEKLKEKLSKEGIFDSDHKKDLPLFPEKIAIVTSPTGAAVRDMIKIITGRNTCVKILVYPVLVQGPKAAEDISSAIYDLNENHKDVDVIITGRGGGSAEELWAFNEEAVVRSIYDSHIPVISAVGHETDVTLSDFAADLRAETPTAAAQMAVPDTEVLREDLEDLKNDLERSISDLTEDLLRHIGSLDPSAFASGLKTRANYEQMHLEDVYEQMKSDLLQKTSDAGQRMEMYRQILDTASPYRILGQGYAFVTDKKGNVVRSLDEVSKGEDVRIRLSDGTAEAEIKNKKKEAADEF